ncbi:MAG: MFS transporter [Gammaproteobacteria bacterium]|nr:MFS transporter [Gammaproteobacteria bacterium]
MFTSITRLSSLLVGVAFLLTGHGLQLGLVPLRAQVSGWGSIEVGLLSSVYFLGFVLGCFSVPEVVRKVGHTRTYASLVAGMTVSILGLSLGDSLVFWLLLRLLTGLSIAGLYLVIESWLNEQVTNEARGSVLAAYTLIVLAGLAAGQLLLNTAAIEGDRLLIIAAILIVLATIPVCISGSAQPQQIPAARFSPMLVLRTSRSASASSFVSGMVSGAIYGLGPVYAYQLGLDVLDISIMMALAITGGALAQLPVGKLSDRMDRRLVILGCMIAGMGVAVSSLLLSDSWVPVILFCFGASVMPIYALSLALASDNVENTSFIEIGTGLLMTNAIGSIIGPFVISQFMFWFGPEYFFICHLVILCVGSLLVLGMIRTRPAAAHSMPDFTLATTAAAQAVMQMDPRGEEEEND